MENMNEKLLENVNGGVSPLIAQTALADARTGMVAHLEDVSFIPPTESDKPFKPLNEKDLG